MGARFTSRAVREHALWLYGLDFSEARSKELARDLERHTTAIAASADVLDFNDEPGRFVVVLGAIAASRGKRR